MDITKLRCLRFALVVIGLFFIFGIYTMMHLAPEGWTWAPRQPEYEYMIVGLYVTLGFFLLKAAKDPVQYKSIIDFTIWSSVVHASIMLVQALMDQHEHANMVGDILGLYMVAIVLFVFSPSKKTVNLSSDVNQDNDDAL